jgi:hypothetical protein
MKDFCDWTQWILEKNAANEQESLSKAEAVAVSSLNKKDDETESSKEVKKEDDEESHGAVLDNKTPKYKMPKDTHSVDSFKAWNERNKKEMGNPAKAALSHPKPAKSSKQIKKEDSE